MHAVLGLDVERHVGDDPGELLVEREPVGRRRSTFSFSLPFSSSACATSSSTEPNSWTSFAAVFSPTPGTPGMLSEVSPLSAT